MSAPDSAPHGGDVSTPERRKHVRQSLRSLSYIQLDEANGGFLLNLSEGGLAVQAAMSVVEDSFPKIKLQIAQSRSWGETAARVAWADDQRRLLGLEFVNLPESTRKQICDWLANEAAAAALPVLDEEEPAEEPINSGSATASVSAQPAPLPEDEIPITIVQPTPPGLPHNSHAHQSHAHQAHAPAKPTPVGEALAAQLLADKNEPIRPLVVAVAESAPVKTAVHGPILSHANTQPKASSRYAPLVIILAALSLAAGWEAGRTNLLQAVEEIIGTSGAPASSTVSAAAADRVVLTNFDVVDSNNQSWTIPFAGPVGEAAKPVAAKPTQQAAVSASPSASSREAQAQPTSLRVWTLTAPTVSRHPASSPTASDAPQLAISQSAPALALPSAIAAPAQPLGNAIDSSRPANLVPASVVRRVDPVYPSNAVRLHLGGAVKLQAHVGLDGKVSDVKTISGSPMLAAAAETAVRQWRYKPAILDGRAIASDVDVTIDFSLPQ